MVRGLESESEPTPIRAPFPWQVSRLTPSSAGYGTIEGRRSRGTSYTSLGFPPAPSLPHPPPSMVGGVFEEATPEAPWRRPSSTPIRRPSSTPILRPSYPSILDREFYTEELSSERGQGPMFEGKRKTFLKEVGTMK